MWKRQGICFNFSLKENMVLESQNIYNTLKEKNGKNTQFFKKGKKEGGKEQVGQMKSK